jgi:hypothetical protein
MEGGELRKPMLCRRITAQKGVGHAATPGHRGPRADQEALTAVAFALGASVTGMDWVGATACSKGQ